MLCLPLTDSSVWLTIVLVRCCIPSIAFALSLEPLGPKAQETQSATELSVVLCGQRARHPHPHPHPHPPILLHLPTFPYLSVFESRAGSGNSRFLSCHQIPPCVAQ